MYEWIDCPCDNECECKKYQCTQHLIRKTGIDFDVCYNHFLDCYVDVNLREEVRNGRDYGRGKLAKPATKEIYDNCKIGDIYRFSGEGQSQLDTNEIKDRMLKVQKEYKELYEQKVKALETSDLDLIHKQGQMIELSIQYEEAKKQK